jgi:DNA-binding SARP family transcriptional activator
MAGGVRLTLLGGFELTHERTLVATPLGAQRLLVYLALQDGGVHRAVAAERLWPDSSPARAGANVRSALWRGRQVGTEPVIECHGPRLHLVGSVAVDLRELLAELALNLRDPSSAAVGSLVDPLRRELLPDWAEDWLTLERERWNQTRLHGLERLAQCLLSQERYLEALQTALGAVAIEPIREAAHRIVIEVHIAEGNVASAIRHYHQYRTLLQHELGVAPSPRMAQLIRPLMAT